MRVLIQALTTAPGGSINVLSTLLRNWPSDDEIVCLAWRPEMVAVLRETGHRVAAIEAGSTTTAMFRTALAHRRQIERWRPDVVFAQQYLLPRVHVPQVVHHRNLLRFEPLDAFSLKTRSRDAGVAATIRRSTTSVFNSHALRKAAVRRYPHLAESRTAVVHNPIDIRDFKQPMPDRDPQTVRVLVPQSDMRHKRNDLAVEVLDRLSRQLEASDSPRRVEMTFVGTGDYATARRAADRLGLIGRVKILGYLTRAKLAEVYAETDVALITSEKESFCNPVIEAHAAGIPIIMTPLPVFDEVSGPLSMIAGEGSAEALTHTLIKGLNRMPIYGKMRDSALRYAQSFSGAVKARAIRDLLEDAMDTDR